MFILTKKLQLLKRDLKGWNKNTFENISENVKKAEVTLRIILNNIQLKGINEILKYQEFEEQSKLSKSLAMEDNFLWNKSKVK